MIVSPASVMQCTTLAGAVSRGIQKSRPSRYRVIVPHRLVVVKTLALQSVSVCSSHYFPSVLKTIFIADVICFNFCGHLLAILVWL